jgi:hypothetical protein
MQGDDFLLVTTSAALFFPFPSQRSKKKEWLFAARLVVACGRERDHRSLDCSITDSFGRGKEIISITAQ